MRILRVALDVPLPQLFDYRVDDDRPVEVGTRVAVPFGNRRLVGVVMEIARSSDVPPERLRAVGAVLDDAPALPPSWIDLVRFASDYYQRPLGEVVHAALPPRLRRPRKLDRPPTAYRLTEFGRSRAAEVAARQKHRRAIVDALSGAPAVRAEALPLLTPAARRTLRELVAEGWVAPGAAPEASRPGVLAAERPPLTAAQANAVDTVLAAHGTFVPFLLHGITGSGKTEVYLRLAMDTVLRGEQVLVLVPEINLTPQLERTFAACFADGDVVTLTSALAETERAERWLAAQTGRARVVLGTRLAVFAPFASLGLVVVDEEHDPSFKQQEGVRYSARDLAVVRGHASGCPVVLGSATPSLESWANAAAGRYRLLALPERARAGAVLPEVRLVDLRIAPAKDGLSETLAEAIEARLARGEQTLLFLNRRGYAPVLGCGACGWASGCARCAAHLVVHLADRRLACHHCGHVEPIPRRCPTCGNVDLVPFGRGTQRLEAALAARFPSARVLRIDSDSTRAKGRWDEMTAAIREGRTDILVGTQILAKGHDFPLVTLVGVLNADAALVAADYRAAERLFAQLEQVAGRAGRAERPGEVLIQTRYPQHPLYRALVEHDFARFAESQLEERRIAGFPPFVHEAVLRAESHGMSAALGFLRESVRHAPRNRDDITVYDPVPMTLPRLGGWERAHVLVQSPSRRALQSFLAGWRATLHAAKTGADLRWHIDVDPIEF